LKLKYDDVLSSFAFKISLRRYNEAAGGREQALRAFQRAAALAPTSRSIGARLDRARNSPGTPLSTRAHNLTSGHSAFEMSFDQVDKEWEATGLQHIKLQEWHQLRRRVCPHGMLLAVTDLSESNTAVARAAWGGASLTCVDT